MPETATVVKKNGKRYVKVGKRRIKVASDISERELIQWMIKHFKPKRKQKKPKVVDPFTAVPPKVTVFQSGTVAVNDANRAALRETKDKLEEVQKKLTTIEEEKKALPPPQAHGYTPEQIEQGLKLLKEQDAEIKRRKAIQEEDKKELKSEKKKRAATAMERRKLERERLEEENKRIKGIMQTTYKEEIKKKGGGFNKLRKLASDKNVNPVRIQVRNN